MMELEQIKKTIEDYDNLIELAISKTKILERIDEKYSTVRGVTEVNFYGDDVNVTYDTSSMGCWDEDSFSFPISWLSKSDDELSTIVQLQKELEAEKERVKNEKLAEKEKIEKENRERKEFERLKSKYEY